MSRPLRGSALDVPVDADAAWRDADLPDGERDAWRSVTASLTRLPDRAVVLSRYGWSPQDVREAQNGSLSYWPADVRDQRCDVPAVDAERIASLAVLANYMTDYHRGQAGLAREIRDEYFAVLSASGWRHSRIGELVGGVSRQRIQTVLREFRARRRVGL